jgi:hypothetical protein
MRKLIYVPHMNNIHISGRRAVRRGRGMGSVLLQTGGPGSASSYESVEEYKDTTGRGLGLGLGLGLSTPDRSGLSKKLESLSINPSKQKPKNIRFNF